MDLRLNTNSTCNLNCKHCYYKAKVGFDGTIMNLEDAKNIINQAYDIYKKNLNIVIMGGGEPFLYKDLPGLLYHLRKVHNINTSLTTNGILLDEKNQNLIKEHDILLNISLEGGEQYNDLIRGGGIFKKVFKNILSAYKNGIRFSINFTLTKNNISEIPFLVKLLSDKAEYITFSRYIPYISNDYIETLSREDYVVVESILNKYKKDKLRFRQENFFRKDSNINYGNFDILNLKSLYILPDMTVYPAWNLIDYKLGDLKNDKLIDILNNQKLEKLYNPDNLNGNYCSNCIFKYNCLGDRGAAYFYTGNFWGDDIQCPYYKERD